MEEITYKLKTDGEVRVGQMKRDLSWERSCWLIVHEIVQRGTIVEVESSIRSLLWNSRQEMTVCASKKIQNHDKLSSRICKILLFNMACKGQGGSWATRYLPVSSTEIGNTGEGKNKFSFGYLEFEMHLEILVESAH